jgi:hypothetical protein
MCMKYVNLGPMGGLIEDLAGLEQAWSHMGSLDIGCLRLNESCLLCKELSQNVVPQVLFLP